MVGQPRIGRGLSGQKDKARTKEKAGGRMKTGNKPHKPYTTEQAHRAKTYGVTHGYGGALGGWIFDKAGYRVAHGWGQFWHRYRLEIIEWEKVKSRR